MLIMNNELKEKLRLLKVDLLRILHVLAITDSVALEYSKISSSTGTAEDKLNGSISTLRRMKIGDESLISPAGRDEDGRLRWQINEQVVTKNELAKFLEDEILGKDNIKIKK